MARTQNLSEYLTDIATAIKAKKNDETPINASRFDEEIANLPSGGGVDEYFVKSSSNNQTYFINRCIKAIPMIDTSGAKSMSYGFYYFDLLKTIPLLNTSNVTNMNYMFGYCTNLEMIPLLDTSNVTNMGGMFQNCSSLKTLPAFNTSKATSFNGFVLNCSKLEELPSYNADNVTNINSALSNCTKLAKFGGFINLGKAFATSSSANYSNYRLDISKTILDHDSLMNLINNLYDIATKGCKTQQLILGSTLLAKLTAEEINIAVEKGFSVS